MRNKLIVLAVIFQSVFTSCLEVEEPNLITLDVSEKTLYYEEEYQIEAFSNTPITYSVDNEYHAQVSDSGLITARYVGETDVILSNGEDMKFIRVKVSPKYNLISEPEVEFGESLISIINKFGTPDGTDENTISYRKYINSYYDHTFVFYFDSQSKLSSYAVFLSLSLNYPLLVTFLLERYLIVSGNNEVFTCINGLDYTSATMSVVLKVYSIYYWQILYSPITRSSEYSPLINQ